MKIVITGSLGNIGLPLTKILVSKGHDVTVISSKAARTAEIEQLGAKAATGTITNIDFLTGIFTGADAVYTMMPPPADFHDPSFNMLKYSETVRNNYFEALKNSGVKHLVNLSSWGAHRADKIGGIAGSYYMEQTLNGLPAEVSITHIRPTSFYYNILNFIPMIRHKGHIELNYGGTDIVSVVAPEDIADAVAAELEITNGGRKVRYVASDELTCNELAGILGAEIGKPGLKWILISNEQAKANLLAAGLSEMMATNVSEIQAAIHNGYLAEHYKDHKPVPGKIKAADYAVKFALAYSSK